MRLAKEECVRTILQKFGPLPKLRDTTYRVWIVRPGRETGHDLVLPVCWNGVGDFGDSDTDYPILAGDRIYVIPRMVEPPRFVQTWAPQDRIMNAIATTTDAIRESVRSTFGGR
jgi:hypothetical protein